MSMTLEEMKLAVCEKLPNDTHIDLAYGSFNKGSRIRLCWYPQMREINWPTEGLQVCHEAEKTMMREQWLQYTQIIHDAVCDTRKYGNINGTTYNIYQGMCHATYEQRLEALCRVWFPERF